MKTVFRYILTDLIDGCIKGTNDLEKAHDCAQCEDYFVYDTVDNVWICPGIELVEIKEL